MEAYQKEAEANTRAAGRDGINKVEQSKRLHD